MPERFSVQWSKVAGTQYAKIRAELRELSPSYLARLVHAVNGSLSLLELWPHFYSPCQYKPERKYRKIIIDNFIILYRVQENRRIVRIAYMFHGAMDIASRIA